jgi:hypothetical protein
MSAELRSMPGCYENYTKDALGKNSEVFNDGDLLTTTGGTGLRVAAASEAIIGVKAGAETMASNNVTVAKVKPAYQPIDQDYVYEMPTNADLNALTSIGTAYNITGTTGAQLVDVAGGATTGTAAIVVCVGVDPHSVGGTGAGSGLRVGLFKIIRLVGAEN